MLYTKLRISLSLELVLCQVLKEPSSLGSARLASLPFRGTLQKCATWDIFMMVYIGVLSNEGINLNIANSFLNKKSSFPYAIVRLFC